MKNKDLSKTITINDYNQVWNIWMTSKDKLYKYVLSRFKDEELAKDVTQEVLLKVHRSCCSGKEIKNLNSWLFEIARNTSIDVLKKESKQKNKTPLTDTPTDGTVWTEISLFLEPLIGFLPEKYATPLRMSDLDKVAQKDIAEQLGIGLSATKSRIQRARKMLKDEINTCFQLEFDRNGNPSSTEIKSDCQPLINFNEKK